MTRRRLLELVGASSLAVAADRAARAEGFPNAEAMRAQAASPILFAHRTPIRIGQAALKVRDLQKMSAFYQHMLGLAEQERTPERAVLGAPGGAPILVLEAAPQAAFAAPDAAGLFHTAFLLPSRLDLARWLAHVVTEEIQLTGFGDHNVSEAVYLDDPEGNGIEVYADRDPAGWVWTNGQVRMGTDPVDFEGLIGLLNDAVPIYTQAPRDLRIGHMHLKVGEVARAAEFYQKTAGLDPTQMMVFRGAAFLSSGRYHHHLGLNSWRSQGAGPRDPAALGLSWTSFETQDAAILAAREAAALAAGAQVEKLASGEGFETLDPWGTRVRFLKV
ncbi:VOC family protein [Neomegalonema sp.]|uniref:VOC family protein n=1 Tax=Neomegalonema sp. TaxID=2039713 RepID=UPI00263759B1|nr:VOC family protein [Neomegalonema sp.]MDD2868502.1 VOC family protein [Neomegalonema sp.]